MRYVIHDYAGHPFQVHLSRHLARRGHDVYHLWNSDNPGPKGMMERRPDDADSLHFYGVSLGVKKKHAAGTGAQFGASRVLRDMRYGREAARLIESLKPHVVLCGNTPADSQRAILRLCKRQDIRFVYWVQDIYSVAVKTLLTKRLGMIGSGIGQYYHWVDHQQFRASDAIITISEDFVPLIGPWSGNTPVSVIENWAPIDDLPVGQKDNDWSRQYGLHDSFAFVYSGTLGRKHNPMFLMKLAQRCPDARMVAVTQGYGVPLLTEAKANQGLDNLKLLPIQPAQQLANVLATADVLLATIEVDAGRFAVPSKVLSYLCAGRPILLAANRNNLAARTVEQAQAEIIVDPADEAGFLAAAERLRDDPSLRAKLGANGRQYAERTFNLEYITDMFDSVLLRVGRSPVMDRSEHRLAEVIVAK